MPEISVLVVDDQDLFRTGLSSLLAAERDIEIAAQASYGRTGVRLAHELQPDVVLMDLEMPDLPGPEATGRSCRSSVDPGGPPDPPLGSRRHRGGTARRGVRLAGQGHPDRQVVTAVRSAAKGVAWVSPAPRKLCLRGCAAPRGNGSHRTRSKRRSYRTSSRSSCSSVDRDDREQFTAVGAALLLEAKAIAARCTVSARIARLPAPASRCPCPRGCRGLDGPRRLITCCCFTPVAATDDVAAL